MQRGISRVTSALAASALAVGFTVSSASAAEVADLSSVTSTEVASILGASGLAVDPASIEVVGNVLQFTQASAGDGFSLAGPGLYLSSGYGDGLPTEPTTGPNVTQTIQQVQQLMETVLNNAGYSTPVTNLSAVVFDVVNPSTPSAQLNFLFLSSEGYNSNWDIAVVIVDGVNYAVLPNSSILRVSGAANLTNLASAGYTLEGEGVSGGAPTQSVTAVFDPTLTRHKVIIAVGDTDDDVVPTFLLIGDVSGSNATSGGIGAAQEILAPVEPVFTFPAFWLWTESTFEISNKPGVIGQFTVDKDVTWSIRGSEASSSFSINSKGELLLTKALSGTSATLAVEARDKDGNSFTRMVDVQVTPSR